MAEDVTGIDDMELMLESAQTFSVLIGYGADVDAVDSTGMTRLHVAAGIPHTAITACLISQGAQVNMWMQHSGNSPLHIAAIAMKTKTTKILEEDISICELLELAQPSTRNQAGVSPLHQACSLGHEELVDLLLRYRASVNELSLAGENCLFLFLNHSPDTRKRFLLMKLLSLSSPLTVCNQDGCLPSTLTQPCFLQQREQLFKLTLQPKTLQHICKTHIYLKHIGRKEEVRKALPESLCIFVSGEPKHFLCGRLIRSSQTTRS
ncbi:LOW QUALITY PROTEIN: ankyrin repeat domain-containing protein 61-like [Fundulus diaphanus]